MQVNKPYEPNIQIIALVVVLLSVFVACFAFVVGRNDPEIRQPIILAMVSLISGLLGLGGGILTSGTKGTQSSSLPTGDIPPGTMMNSTQSTTVKTPPDASQLPEAPK